MAGDIESFIIFPCSWYNLLPVCYLGLRVSHSFSRGLIPWNVESRIGTLDSKKIVVKGGKKETVIIESKILRSVLLALVFNS